jgi:lysophospholipase L1-like esterase
MSMKSIINCFKKKRLVTGITLVAYTLTLVISCFVNISYALSSKQKEVFDSGVRYFDVSTECGDSSGSTSSNPSSKIYLLGDSILEGSYYTTGYLKQNLDDNNWDSTADASAGRSITTPGSDPSNDRQGHEQSGLKAIDTDTDIIKSAGVVVIELGTNTSGSASQFEDQMKQVIQKINGLNSNARIFWVNIISKSNPIYPSYNKTINKVAGPQKVTVIDANSNNITLSADNTHPTTAGYKDYSQALSDAIGPAGGGAGNAPSTGSCCSSSSSTTTLSGSDNEEKVWNFFKGKGLSDVQIAGIMGNMFAESGFDPQNIQNPGGRTKDPSGVSGGWGLIQWTPGSKVLDEAKQAGVNGPIYLLSTQLDLVWHIMHNDPVVTKPFDLDLFKKMTTLEQTTGYWLTQIEAPQVPNLSQRINQPGGSKDILNKYGGSGTGGSSTSGGQSCATADTTSPDCQTASGNAKILCEAKKYKGNYYSMGAGHDGYHPFKDRCPSDKAVSLASKSTPSDPGPCATDCSSLVSIALDDAFGKDYMWSVRGGSMEGSGSENWKRIDISTAKAGDIVTTEEHVEIVDHVRGSTVYTFGSHHTGTKTGLISTTSYFTEAFRWTGPGSS